MRIMQASRRPPHQLLRQGMRNSWLARTAAGEVTSVCRRSVTFLATGCTLGQVVRVLPAVGADEADARTNNLQQTDGLARVVEARADGVCIAELTRPVDGLGPGCLVQLHPPTEDVPSPDALLCRVTDGWLQPTDDIHTAAVPPVSAAVRPSDGFIPTGHAVIDVLHPWRIGTRMVVAGPAGSGKTTLITQLLQAPGVDHVIVAAIGERGHEIPRLTALARSQCTPWTVIGCSAATSVYERFAALNSAVRLAQASARRGRHVLLLVDSLTRWARAASQATLGATSTEAAATDLALIELLAGSFEACLDSGDGCITAVFSTLTNAGRIDRLTEECLALSDGHWILDRRIAQRQLHPAVDPLLSLCRGIDDASEATDSLRISVMDALQTWQTHGDSIELGLVQPEPDSALGRLARHHADLSEWLYARQGAGAMIDAGLNIVGTIQPQRRT